VCIAAVVFAGTAAAAVAYSNTDYFYGSAGVASLNESSVAANCHIWGLSLTHNLTGCKGDNLIVADGQCPPGTTNGDNDQYCEITQDSGDQGDTLRGGGGNNVIVGGGGPNTIYGGAGSNAVDTGPSTNTYFGGNAGDAVYAGIGSGTINLGTGLNIVYASSSGVYHIICTGHNDTVFMRSQDTANDCANVHIIDGDRDAAPRHSRIRHRGRSHHKHA
jgi:hypothetical protein